MKEKSYLFDEFEEKKLEGKLDPSGDLFQRHPVFYFLLCVFLILGSAYFLLNLLGVIGAIGILV